MKPWRCKRIGTGRNWSLPTSCLHAQTSGCFSSPGKPPPSTLLWNLFSHPTDRPTSHLSNTISVVFLRSRPIRTQTLFSLSWSSAIHQPGVNPKWCRHAPLAQDPIPSLTLPGLDSSLQGRPIQTARQVRFQLQHIRFMLSVEILNIPQLLSKCLITHCGN